MKTIILSVLACFSVCASAQDSWNGSDKAMHFGVSMALGFAAANQWPNQPVKAWGIAMIPGTLKELSDSQKGGTGFSGKDMAANALGAALGVATGNWLISRNKGTTLVAYRQEF